MADARRVARGGDEVKVYHPSVNTRPRLPLDAGALSFTIPRLSRATDRRARVLPTGGSMRKHYLLVSDFDQTLSFNDSGVALSEMIGINGFHEKVKALSRLNLVQAGAELSKLLRHDPAFRGVCRQRGRGHVL